MSIGEDPATRLKLTARLLLLTGEIERLRLLGPDDELRQGLRPKIDEAAEILDRIGLLDVTSSNE